MINQKQESKVFRAIADPTRRAILDKLRAGPTNVNRLAADFRQTRPAISKHLRVLRQAAIVIEEKHSRERIYQLVPESLNDVFNWINPYREFWQNNLTQLKLFVEGEQNENE